MAPRTCASLLAFRSCVAHRARAALLESSEYTPVASYAAWLHDHTQTGRACLNTAASRRRCRLNDAGAGMFALVGHPSIAMLVLALMLLPAEVLGCRLLDRMEVPLWTPLATQWAFLHAASFTRQGMSDLRDLCQFAMPRQ